MDNKDNANPLILDASDLPSRRGADTVRPRADGGTGLFDGLLNGQSPYSLDPFAEKLSSSSDDDSSSEVEEIDAQEVYGMLAYTASSPQHITQSTTNALTTDLIAPISDPEHPLSLGSLNVVQLSDIHITTPSSTSSSPFSTVLVEITPTITHCSLATVIGLGVRVRLEQALPPRFRVDVRVKEGTHSTDTAVSKQLGDKERVAAALENGTLVGVLEKMLATCE